MAEKSESRIVAAVGSSEGGAADRPRTQARSETRAHPIIAPGRGVKYYEEGDDFGRQDGTCIRVDNTEGIIDLRTVRTGRRISNVAYRDNIENDLDPYWVELPEGYVPGSEGY